MSRPTARVAYLAAALNAIAAVAMLLVLREGLPVPGASVDTRIEFINHHHALWNAGWLTWHLAALSLVALYAVLALRWLPTRRLESVLGLAFAVAGLTADLSAEALYMGLLASLRSEAFLTAERVIGLLTGYVANGLYTLGGIALTIAGRDELPRALIRFSIVVWLAGLALSATTLMDSGAGEMATTAILMPSFILWTFLIGRWLDRID